MTGNSILRHLTVSPRTAFLLVAFSLGQLGDGLNVFQGIYLVGIGWKEGAVGAALSFMGLTSLLVQPVAGDWVDKATIDRRFFLTIASIVTACSASAILLVRHGDHIADHRLIYATKIMEGIASSFIGPCLAALTLASFGPNQFDAIMASNVFWGHVGSVVAAVLAGIVAYCSYPDIKYCFLVIGGSALVAILFVHQLPEGDPLLGRGFKRQEAEESEVEIPKGETSKLVPSSQDAEEPPTASSYMDVFLDPKTCILGITGFFFHFANANVLLVLGEIMGQRDDNEEGTTSRTAIPFTAGAIVMAQFTMAVATIVGDRFTEIGVGRKPLFMAALLSLPIRCALIIWWKDASTPYLLSTQILDGVGGGLFALIHPYLIADITFGTGRFNVVMGLTASCFGMGATLSNFLGQMVVQHFGHVASLTASLLISTLPIVIFSAMPETYGMRGNNDAGSGNDLSTTASSLSSSSDEDDNNSQKDGYETFQISC